LLLGVVAEDRIAHDADPALFGIGEAVDAVGLIVCDDEFDGPSAHPAALVHQALDDAERWLLFLADEGAEPVSESNTLISYGSAASDGREDMTEINRHTARAKAHVFIMVSPTMMNLVRFTACILALALVSGAASPALGQAALIPVKVASTPDDTFVAVFYAQRTGMFRQAGLDVQLEPSGTSGAAIAAGVASGAYDIGKSSLTSILAAHLRNIPFTLIAPGTLYDPKTPYGLLIVAKDSPIKSAKDLNGQTVAVAALNSLDQAAILAWMDQNGGDGKTLKFIELPQSEDGPALAQHRIAASLTIRPQLDQALASGQARALAPAFSAISRNYLVSAWFTTTEYAGKHPDVIAKFRRIVEQSAAYGNRHHDVTAPLLSEVSKIPLSVITSMERGVLGTQLTPALVQPVIDVSAKYKTLSRAFPASEVIWSGS
jgi:NitT/TauT family transport system substrate-binding protein